MAKPKKPPIEERVILVALPPGFLDGLPEEDQRAVTAMIGKPVTLVGYNEDGRAELEFNNPFAASTKPHSRTHTIWVPPECVKPLPK